MLLFSFKLAALGLMMLKGKVLIFIQTEDNVPSQFALVLADLFKLIYVCVCILFCLIAWILTKTQQSLSIY